MARRLGGIRRDLDAAWKSALRELFPDFLAFVHEELHRAIDWSRPPEFLDKEMQSVSSICW